MRNHLHIPENRIPAAPPRRAPPGVLVILALALLLGTAIAQQNPAGSGAPALCDTHRTVSLALDTSGEVFAPGIDLTCALLSGADLEVANLRGADLTRADLSGAILRFADLSCAITYAADLSGAKLRGANLDHAILTNATLSGASLRNATLRGAVLTGADLGGADLYGADLHESWFDDATIWPEGFDPIAAGAIHVE